jgi:formate dehydrogenase iron-sulfur subunit
VKPADFKEIQEACPYNIPRINTLEGKIAKCTMCSDRVKGGMVPACVKTCPTGAMNFGDRKEILEKAKKRLEMVQRRYEEAMLTDMDDVRIFYLLVDDPKKYYKHAVAENSVGITRKMALKRLFQPLRMSG